MRGLRRWNQLYELWTGLYMLDPWEKALFSEYDGRASSTKTTPA